MPPPDATGSHRWNGNEDHEETGRWPANIVHDGSEEVLALFPVTTARSSMRGERKGGVIYGNGKGLTSPNTLRGHDDAGSAARFFYCAKASRADREEGCERLDAKLAPKHNIDGRDASNPKIYIGGHIPQPVRNHHPTVKPTSLMRWLVRLVTPPGGVVLDPFAGSGSTGKACVLEGFRFIGIELDAEYLDIAQRRIGSAQPALLAAGV